MRVCYLVSKKTVEKTETAVKSTMHRRSMTMAANFQPLDMQSSSSSRFVLLVSTRSSLSIRLSRNFTEFTSVLLTTAAAAAAAAAIELSADAERPPVPLTLAAFSVVSKVLSLRPPAAAVRVAAADAALSLITRNSTRVGLLPWCLRSK